VNSPIAQKLEKADITNLVLGSIRDANQLRAPELQIEVSSQAALFGGAGVLDSLSLVALLLDVEELLLDRDCEISLSSEDAMSQANSPYRDVQSLVDYIHKNLEQDS